MWCGQGREAKFGHLRTSRPQPQMPSEDILIGYTELEGQAGWVKPPLGHEDFGFQIEDSEALH